MKRANRGRQQRHENIFASLFYAYAMLDVFNRANTELLSLVKTAEFALIPGAISGHPEQQAARFTRRPYRAQLKSLVGFVFSHHAVLRPLYSILNAVTKTAAILSRMAAEDNMRTLIVNSRLDDDLAHNHPAEALFKVDFSTLSRTVDVGTLDEEIAQTILAKES